jgi:NADH-quinone oxidoreductase subunit L
LQTPPFWLMMAGFAVATGIWLLRPQIAGAMHRRLPGLYRLLDNKYYFDQFNQRFFANGTLRLGRVLWQRADNGLIDGLLVNGSARLVQGVAARVRRLQTGFLYDYAFSMIIGVIAILAVWVVLQ